MGDENAAVDFELSVWIRAAALFAMCSLGVKSPRRGIGLPLGVVFLRPASYGLTRAPPKLVVRLLGVFPTPEDGRRMVDLEDWLW
jgi:hypothetical protein